MGGSTTKTTTQNSQTQPWAPAQPLLGGILGQLGGALDSTGLTGNENAALSGLEANARAGNPYAPAIGGLATDLLRGGGPDRTGLASGAYDAYQAALTPFARGDHLNPAANPALQGYLGTIADDVQARVNGMFAGAGRDLSGANVQALSRGIAQGEAPVLADAYNRALDRQAQAIDKLYGAGGQTAGLLSNLDQAALANRQAGVGVAGSAVNAQLDPLNRLLAVEAQRRGIPLDALQRIAAMASPIAGLGHSSSGTSTEETSVPLADKLAGWAALALAATGKMK
jgi:hypothetical protein